MSGPSALAPALSLQGVGKEYRLYASPRQRLRAVLFTDEQAELLGVAPPMIPADPRAALRMRQLEALADGVMEAAQALVREKARPGAQQSEQELLRQREKVARGLDRLEACAADGTLRGDEVNLATISTACAIAYLNFRRVAPGWCATRPQLVKLVDALFQRASFARTEPPRT